MGIPIEPRLSQTALRKRKRLSPELYPPSHTSSSTPSSTPPSSPQPSAPPPPSPPTGRQGRLRHTFGVNHAALSALTRYYETHAARRPAKARLHLVSTQLPSPVSVHRSPIFRIGARVAAALLRDMPLRYAARADALRDGDVTTSAVSVLYAEEGGDPEHACLWELGCWAGTHRLAGVDMFQLFLDVLTEAAAVPGCPIDALCIRDGLQNLSGVADGVDLLKDLSAELHASYDRQCDYFLHPITGTPVEIIVTA